MGAYFELILFLLTIASGIIALIDIVFFAKKRKAAIEATNPTIKKLSKKAYREATKGPWLADYARSLFPVFFIVLLLRSFLGEPFRIPSGSMQPTLQIGDFILVSRYDFGLKFPVWNWHLTATKLPKRGDVVVLHFPVNTKVDFIKRVIGLPGDTISYVNKELIINGQKMTQKYIGMAVDRTNFGTYMVKEYQEDLDGVKHLIYRLPSQPDYNFYNLKVPQGYVFVMGDNRDLSDDSRYWGFVPLNDLVGRARRVIFSWSSHSTDLRWHRLGEKIH